MKPYIRTKLKDQKIWSLIYGTLFGANNWGFFYLPSFYFCPYSPYCKRVNLRLGKAICKGGNNTRQNNPITASICTLYTDTSVMKFWLKYKIISYTFNWQD